VSSPDLPIGALERVERRVVSGLLVGISYGWWMNKHSRHHASPNQLGKDPDIESRAVAFSSEAADRRRGLGAWLARRQGSFFLALLMLEGVSLHASSIGRALGRRPVKHRPVEITFLAVRILGSLGLVFLLLPPGIATASSASRPWFSGGCSAAHSLPTTSACRSFRMGCRSTSCAGKCSCHATSAADP
jgi:fatty acid desaturase